MVGIITRLSSGGQDLFEDALDAAPRQRCISQVGVSSDAPEAFLGLPVRCTQTGHQQSAALNAQVRGRAGHLAPGKDQVNGLLAVTVDALSAPRAVALLYLLLKEVVDDLQARSCPAYFELRPGLGDDLQQRQPGLVEDGLCGRFAAGLGQ